MTRDSDYERRNEALHKAILARKEADTAEDIQRFRLREAQRGAAQGDPRAQGSRHGRRHCETG